MTTVEATAIWGSTSKHESRNTKESSVAAFVALCGVFDIVAHFRWEMRRGVHEISALKPANSFYNETHGAFATTAAAAAAAAAVKDTAMSATSTFPGTGDHANVLDGPFSESSPTLLARAMGKTGLWGTGGNEKSRNTALPRVVRLFHSRDDTTVSIESTEQFYRALVGGDQQTPSVGHREHLCSKDISVSSKSSTSQESEDLGIAADIQMHQTATGGHGGILLDLILGRNEGNVSVLSLIEGALESID